MDLESLKRVLLELKGEARSMKGNALKSRLMPKEEASPEVDEAAAAGEGVAEEEMAEGGPPGLPDEGGMDGEPPVEGEPEADSAEMAPEDKAALARIFAKYGLG